MTSDRRFYVNVLKSPECQCGRTKKPGRALCWPCYQPLPRYMQDDLHQSLGDGFEEAYEAAVAWLNS